MQSFSIDQRVCITDNAEKMLDLIGQTGTVRRLQPDIDNGAWIVMDVKGLGSRFYNEVLLYPGQCKPLE